ncbi:MAG TPA: hypothetical protein VGH99_11770 [Pseudonocardia sp.]
MFDDEIPRLARLTPACPSCTLRSCSKIEQPSSTTDHRGVELSSQPLPRDLMKDTELGDEWHLSPKTLANRRLRGEGPPFIRIGRTIRYSRQACAEWLAAQQD